MTKKGPRSTQLVTRAKRLSPVHPGGLPLEEFMIPQGLSANRLAKEIFVPARRIGEIVKGRRPITEDTDLRLCRFFELTDGYWLRAQITHDIEVVKAELGKALRMIKPWSDRINSQ
jgi:addiction module HigA family antidote